MQSFIGIANSTNPPTRGTGGRSLPDIGLNRFGGDSEGAKRLSAMEGAEPPMGSERSERRRGANPRFVAIVSKVLKVLIVLWVMDGLEADLDYASPRHLSVSNPPAPTKFIFLDFKGLIQVKFSSMILNKKEYLIKLKVFFVAFLIPSCNGNSSNEVDVYADEILQENLFQDELFEDKTIEDLLSEKEDYDIEQYYDTVDMNDITDIQHEIPDEIWRPVPGTSWQLQLSGSIDTSFEVQMYDIDLFDTPESVISNLHSRGIKVVCYFSAGSYEDWREDAHLFPQEVIGFPLEGWSGENWLDIRSPVVRNIMTSRLGLAVEKKCDGVDPDNVNGYANETGFPLTYNDQLDYNIFISSEAHSRGLSVGLKNDIEQVGDLLPYFEWELNEECFTYNECELLVPFITSNKPVFQVEYGDESLVEEICPQANAMNFDTLIKNIELDSWRISCR